MSMQRTRPAVRAAYLAVVAVCLATPAGAQDSGSTTKSTSPPVATAVVAAGDLVSASLVASLSAAVSAGRVRVTCSAGADSGALASRSRQVHFATEDGARQATVSLVASSSASADTGEALAFTNAEVLVLERGTGIAERGELFADGSLSVRRTAPGGIEPGASRTAEVTPYPAGDPLAREIRSLARRAWALPCR